jgi:antitoxin (DNA-binding transcriptional repressor) of toxin-antitoxin stability system
MAMEETLSVTDFKMRCLELLKRIGQRKLDRITVTRHGQVVAVITPPLSPAQSLRAFHGSMKDRTVIPPGLDLTEPVLDEPLDAEQGILHR